MSYAGPNLLVGLLPYQLQTVHWPWPFNAKLDSGHVVILHFTKEILPGVYFTRIQYIYIHTHIYINFSVKNQSQPTLLFALLKITERPGFGLHSHHQVLQKHKLRNCASHGLRNSTDVEFLNPFL
jgi:hypothetical protein